MWLARKLGRTVHELRATMTPAEFAEQLVFDLRRQNEQIRAREEAKRR